MKYLLFLTFCVLTLFVNAQDKMGFGNDPEGADSAGFGAVTTWVKPTPSTDTITYEGTLTVGYDSFEYEYGFWVKAYGYISESIGSLSPVFDGNYMSLVIAFEETNIPESVGISVSSTGDNGLSVSPFSPTTEILSFEIDNIGYSLTKVSIDPYYEWGYVTTTNPFPAVGETCTIKIKYTSQ